jgi:hypothetical protein
MQNYDQLKEGTVLKELKAGVMLLIEEGPG